MDLKCPSNVFTYTDLDACGALLSNGLNIDVQPDVLSGLSWVMSGATNDASPLSGINQINYHWFNEGTTEVVYRGIDHSNRIFTCSFKVTVADNQSPFILNLPKDISAIALPGECAAPVTWPELFVKDNCMSSGHITPLYSHTSGDWFPVGTTAVSVELSDGVPNNNVSYTFEVKVLDKEAPVLELPPPGYVECGNAVPDAFTSWENFIKAGGDAFDNCGIIPESFRFVSQKSSGIRCPYKVERVYEIADESGNIARAAHLIFVGGELPFLKSGKAVCTAIYSGNWNVDSIWSCGTVPGSGDDVLIPSGITVSVDAAATCRNLEIESGATLNHGTNLATNLQVNGDWINNGSYEGGTNGVVEFVGNNPATISGDTNFEGLTFNKTGGLSTLVSILDNVNVLSGGELIMTSGLVTISSGGSLSVNPSRHLYVEKDAGFDVSGGTLNTGAFSITNEGMIRIGPGSTANLGTSSGNEVHTQVDGAFIVTGGVVNIAGRLYNSASGILSSPGLNSGITITGGTVTLCTQGNGLSNVGSLQVTSAGSFSFTGGTIVFQNPSSASTELDLGLLSGTGIKNTSEGIFQFGNAATPAGSVFKVNSQVLLGRITSVPNVDIELLGDLWLENLNLDATSVLELNGNTIKQNLSGTGNYDFPLGDGAGNSLPVAISLISGGIGAGASVRVNSFAAKHPDNASSGNYLNRYWTITLSGVVNPQYSISVTYSEADIVGDESNIAGGLWTGSSPWIKGSVLNGSGNTFTLTGVSVSNAEFTGITLAPPSVLINGGAVSEEICAGGSGVLLRAVPVGDAPWTYSWSPEDGLSNPNQASPLANPLTSTTYIVTVTDGNGFTATDDIQVVVDPQSVGGTASTNQTICTGASPSPISLSGSTGAVQWQWSDDNLNWINIVGATGTALSSTSMGTLSTTRYYRAEVQSGICSPVYSNVVTVAVSPEPDVNGISDRVACHDENVASISFSGSIPGTIFYWVNSDPSIGLPGNGTGDLPAFVALNTENITKVAQLTVTPVFRQNGVDCSGSPETFTITVKPVPTVSATPATQQICPGGAITQIDITNPNNVAGTTFSWTRDNTSVLTGIPASGTGSAISGTLNSTNPGTLETTTFTITATASGCSSTTTVTVTVGDVDPPSAVCQDVTVQLDATGTATITENAIDNGSSDACGSISFDTDITSFDCTDIGVNPVVLTVTDNAGNTATCNATVTVGDYMAPTISCPSNLTYSSSGGSCGRNVNGSDTSPVAYNDNCGVSSLAWTLTGATTGSGTGVLGNQIFNVGVTTVTYTVADAVGNTNSCSFLVIITDDEPPVITCPADVTVYTGPARSTCNQTATWENPAVSDNCTPIGNITVTSTHSSGDIFPVGTTNVTYTAEDGNGNQSTCSFDVTVIDNTPPVPPSAIATVFSDCEIVSLPAPVAIDNCDGSVSGTTTTIFPIRNPGATTVEWIFTDIAGNSSIKNQIVYIEDDQSPVWDNPSFFTNIVNLQCGNDTTPVNTGIPTATDNCGPVTITYSDVVTSGSCPGNYTITRTWTATDTSATGNPISRQQRIYVTDNTPPTLVCRDTSVASPNDIFSADLLLGLSFSDNCGIDTVFLMEEYYTFNNANHAGFCPETVVRKYVVYDQCGNVSPECMQVITVESIGDCEVCQDRVPYFLANLNGAPDSLWISPEIRRQGICCGASQEPGEGPPRCVSFNVYLDEDAVGLIFDRYSGAWPSGAKFYQIECGPEIPVGEVICLDGGQFYTVTFCKPGNNPNEYSIQSVAGAITTDSLTTRADVDCFGELHVSGLEPSTIHWSVSYPAGRSDLLRYLDTTDIENPIFYPDSLTPALIKYQVCGTLLGTPECDGNPITDCGEVIVNVLPPVKINLDVDLATICEEDIPVIEAEIPYEDPSLTYTFTWFDGPDGTGNIVSTNRSYQPLNEGIYSVLVTEVTSGVGCNSDFTNFNIVYDHVGPVVVTPPDTLLVDCNDIDLETIIVNWIGNAEAFDEDGSSVSVGNNYEPFDPGCGTEVWVHFWADDICGNRTLDSALIIVQDDLPPVISPEALNGSAECAGTDPDQNPDYLAWLASYGGAAASDECDNTLAWTADTATAVWSNDPVNNQITVTFTTTDDCGNSDQTTATFTITDTQPPTVICPPDISETAAPNNCSKTLVTPADPIISDVCSNPVLTWELTGATTGTGSGSVTGQTFNVGVTTVTYTVTDAAGLTESCSFNVTILDVTPPFIEITSCVDVMEDAVPNNCSKVPDTLTVPVYSDDCWPNDSLVLTYTITGATIGAGIGTVAGISFNIGVSTVTYTVIDPDGNSASCTFTVTIVDVTPPFIEIAGCSDVTETIGANDCFVIPAAINDPVYHDDCWPNDSLKLSYVITGTTTGSGTGSVRGLIFNLGISTVEYTVMDPDGNQAVCTFTVTILRADIPPAVIACPNSPASVYALPGLCEAPVLLDAPEISDPCATAIYSMINDYNNSDAANDTYPVGTTTVTWTITDNSGNVVNCEQKVEVVDDQGPIITCPADVEDLISDGGCSMVSGLVGRPNISDNCAVESLTWEMSGATTGSSPAFGINYADNESYNVGVTTVTYTLTDTAGLSSECSQIVWIKNIDAPQFSVDCSTAADVTQPADPGECYGSISPPVPSINNPCNEVYTVSNDWPLQVDSMNIDGIYPIGTTTVIWTITDASGNVSTCVQNITVTDLLPTLVCPPDLTVQADYEKDYASDVVVGIPTFDDNCPDSSLTYVVTAPSGSTIIGDSNPSGINMVFGPNTYELGTTEIAYTFTDAHGHVVTCSHFVTVLGAPVIDCPPDTTVYVDASGCTKTFDPGMVTLLEGAPPITWTYTITFPDGTTQTDTYVKNTPNQEADPLGEIEFPLGTTTIAWRAENISGFDECAHAVVVIDTVPPVFEAPDFIACVDPLYWAVYNPANPTPIFNHIDPLVQKAPVDYYTLEAGSRALDLVALSDNCCDSTEMQISWRIDFSPTPDPQSGVLLAHPPISGTGQPSEYRDPINGSFTDIYLWGDGVTFQPVLHTISYWVTDCNGNVTPVVVKTITITPRPQIVKVY